jgi:hypothetical protein
MKLIARSEWTSIVPKSTVGAEDLDGPPFLRTNDVKGFQVFRPDEQALFVELNPFSFIERICKENFTQLGYGDIQYNLAVTPNVDGVFCLRGLTNKSPAFANKARSNNYISVLCLLGNEEPPTDLLLKNLSSCRELIQSKFPNAQDILCPLPTDFPFKQSSAPSLPNVFTQDSGIHVFDLIEVLSFWSYYNGRNDGVYGPVTTNAVMLLQADLRDGSFYRKRVDGIYGRYTREAFLNFLRQL